MVTNTVPLAIGQSPSMTPALNDIAEASSFFTSTTCVERGLTPETRSHAVGKGIGSTTAAEEISHATAASKNNPGSSSGASVTSKPHVDPKSIYIPPHRRRKSTETGIFLKPLASTIPFPIAHDEPKLEIKSEPATDENVFKITADSKYRVCCQICLEFFSCVSPRFTR